MEEQDEIYLALDDETLDDEIYLASDAEGEHVTEITVRSALMGSGKSTKMIAELNDTEEDVSWIIVLPFIEECERYKKDCPTMEFAEPEKYGEHGV